MVGQLGDLVELVERFGDLVELVERFGDLVELVELVERSSLAAVKGKAAQPSKRSADP